MNKSEMDLKYRLIVRTALVLPIMTAGVFAPAGSFAFWQGWAFLGSFVVFTAVFSVYFYRRDRKLLERRLRNREPRAEQRLFKIIWVPLWIATLMLPGFDYRFGWSEKLAGGVQVWLMAACWAVVAIAWWLVFEVMRFNSFASTVVQVEAGQKVITNGPYRLVRHPMYTGFSLMILALPFAMGSYVAALPALPLIPLLIYRLLDEERVLRKELSGYTEYCDKTRFRLIPSVF